MKKTGVIVLAAALLGFVQFAQAQEVHSVNIVGFVKKPLPKSTLILTTSNFDQIDGTTNTLLSVFGTNQLKKATSANNPNSGDKIQVWNPTLKVYESYLQWTNGLFYLAGSTTQWQAKVECSSRPIPAGAAMWIKSNDSVDKDVVFSGEVVDVSTQTIQIVQSLQLIAYPFTSAINLQDTSFANCGAKKATSANNPNSGDRIQVWTGNAYQQYTLGSGTNGWLKSNTTAEYQARIPATNTLQLAEGFWYNASSGSGVISNGWTEVKKY